MSLPPGRRLGPYEVVAPLGAGGMGEVYRAKDSRLKREVALKVLPPAVASDPDRLARFQREAEVLAALNHPHIAQIYGIEEAADTSALVMELVEGDDLAQRITRGPIAFEDAVGIGKQLTEALAAAHDAGIVHRDLKPANIKVRPDGTVKVLDFGLAKPLDTAAALPPTQTPTLTSPAMTMGGVILGTAAYMAPEQARGRPVDKRADIWAFGCVFYEMLTGERLFRGDALTDVLASVIKDEPDVSKAPAGMHRLLKRCLEKDPRDRLRDIGDAWALVDEPGPAMVLPPSTSRLPWAIATVLAVVAATLGIWAMRPAATAPAPLVQFQLPIAEEAGAMPGAVMSPDGRRIAYSSGNQVWIRDLGALLAKPVPEADPIVVQPFWSADSRFFLFTSGGALKKVDDSGGAAQTICPLPGALSGGFTDGDRVVFATAPGGIFTVPFGGGKPVPLLAPDGSHWLRSGALLPDRDHFVFTVVHPAEDRRGIHVASITGADRPKRLLPDVSAVIYVPSGSNASGSLLLTRGDAIIAQPFNPERLELSGEPSRVVEDVRAFSASTNGAIVYRAAGTGRRLTWMDREGNAIGTVGTPDQHLEVALSRDGARAAVVRYERNSPPATWVFDLVRESSRRLAPVVAIKPVWSADGKEIVVASRDLSPNANTSHLLRLPSDGTGTGRRLLGGETFKMPRDLSPDGKWLLYVQPGPTTKEDLFLLSLLPGEHEPEPFLATDYVESDGMFSPDGRFVAYVSNETGRFEVYVRSFPGPAGGKWQISKGGGYQPRWRRDGKELFFFTADGRLMSTDVTLGAKVQSSVPRTLFRAPVFSGGATVSNHYWDVSPDGQRFLINTTSIDDASTVLTVLLNWRSGSSDAGRN